MSENVEIGFKRSEMGSVSLPGTAGTGGCHLFLVWGKAAEWPKKVPEGCPEDSLPQKLQAALDEAKKSLVLPVKCNVIEAGDEDKEGDVLVFPYYLRFHISTENNTGLKNLITFLSTKIKPTNDMEDLTGAFAFICAHKHRDARCGFCGPHLHLALEDYRRKNLYTDVKPRLCSHQGGHKFAGNVIMFSGQHECDDGHWYGYVTPDNLHSVLSGTAKRSNLWRGQLGLGKEDAKAEAQRSQRVEVLKRSTPFVLASTILIGVIVGVMRCRRGMR